MKTILLVDDDESILLPYCASGRAPNRVYLVRFRVNKSRTDISKSARLTSCRKRMI